MSSLLDLILSSLVVDGTENRWTNDIDGYVLEAQPGRSQGRPMKSRGWKPIAQ